MLRFLVVEILEVDYRDAVYNQNNFWIMKKGDILAEGVSKLKEKVCAMRWFGNSQVRKGIPKHKCYRDFLDKFMNLQVRNRKLWQVTLD